MKIVALTLLAVVACTALQHSQTVHRRTPVMQKKWTAFMEQSNRYKTLSRMVTKDMQSVQCPKQEDDPQCSKANADFKAKKPTTQAAKEEVCGAYWTYDEGEDTRVCEYIENGNEEEGCVLGP